MSTALRGIHPRLIPRFPDPRPSLAILPALRELGDEFAWVVWYVLWRVRGGDPGHDRDGGECADRFGAALGCVPVLDDALRVLCAYLQTGEGQPDAADALLHVSEWALERGLGEPAMQCAGAAAALMPESARRALAAGRASRIFGEVAQAEMYYERAVTLARMSRKWRTYVRGHLGLGQVKKALGDPAAARAHYFTAARAARSLSGEKWLAAQTRHELLVLAAEEGVFDEALRHAREALEWYPRHHARFPALAHDLGFLLVRVNLHEAAVHLLNAVMRLPIPPEDQVIGWSTLARAAAGTGDAAAYTSATEQVLRRVALFDHHAAAAFDNLARGACSIDRWTEAEQYATRSLEIAAHRAQNESVANARRALANARAQRRCDPSPPAEERLVSSLIQLARDVAHALESWRGPTWRRKRQYGPDRLGSV